MSNVKILITLLSAGQIMNHCSELVYRVPCSRERMALRPLTARASKDILHTSSEKVRVDSPISWNINAAGDQRIMRKQSSVVYFRTFIRATQRIQRFLILALPILTNINPIQHKSGVSEVGILLKDMR